MATGSSGTLRIVIYALKIVDCALDLTSGKIDDDFSFFYTSWANTLHIHFISMNNLKVTSKTISN